MLHRAHIQSAHFHAILKGEKRFEIFDAVSGIQKGDQLMFEEVVPVEGQLKPSGQQMTTLVSFITYIKESDKLVASLILVPTPGAKENELPVGAPDQGGAASAKPAKKGGGAKKPSTNGASLAKPSKPANGKNRSKPAAKRSS